MNSCVCGQLENLQHCHICLDLCCLECLCEIENTAYVSVKEREYVCKKKCVPNAVEMTRQRHINYLTWYGGRSGFNLRLPFEEWLEVNPYYKCLFKIGMDFIEGPLGQFTKPVKME